MWCHKQAIGWNFFDEKSIKIIVYNTTKTSLGKLHYSRIYWCWKKMQIVLYRSQKSGHDGVKLAASCYEIFEKCSGFCWWQISHRWVWPLSETLLNLNQVTTWSGMDWTITNRNDILHSQSIRSHIICEQCEGSCYLLFCTFFVLDWSHVVTPGDSG